MKLVEICSVISRGFNYARSEISKDKFCGYSVPQIGFSDIHEDGTFNTDNQIVFIRKSIANNYLVSNKDIILPPTTTALPQAKGIKKDGVMLDKFVYSQNAVIIRLEENAPITSIELITLLNTPKMQKALLEEVYTGKRVKSVSIEKLRNFEIPPLTDKQKERLTRYIEVSEKFYQAKKRFEEEFWEEDF